MKFAYESEDVTGAPCWLAVDTSVPGPYAIGDSASEALKRLETALAVWGRVHPEIETTRTFGNAVPLRAESFTFDPRSGMGTRWTHAGDTEE